MSRELSSGFDGQLGAATKEPLLFFEGVMKTSIVRMWTGIGEIEWNGQTWLGAGAMASVSPVRETSEVVAEGLSVTLAGIPTDLLSLVLNEVQQNNTGRIWLAFMDDDGSIVADPALAFVGRLDTSNVRDDAESLTVTIQYESRLRDFERNRSFRYTTESQETLFADDKGFDFVPSLQEWNGVWGKS